LRSDDLETGKYTIFVKDTQAADVDLRFKIHYRDSYDQSFTQDVTLKNPLYSKAQAQSLGLVKGSNGGLVIAIIVVIVIIVAVILIRRRNRKHN
jgi:subtilase family serine protease